MFSSNKKIFKKKKKKMVRLSLQTAELDCLSAAYNTCTVHIGLPYTPVDNLGSRMTGDDLATCTSCMEQPAHRPALAWRCQRTAVTDTSAGLPIQMTTTLNDTVL